MGEVQVRGPSSPAPTIAWARRPTSSPPTAGCAPATSATLDALGYLRITDRTKDLIKSGGEWISSVDLENALMAHPAVAEAAVIAHPAREMGRAAIGVRGVQTGPQRRCAELGEHLLQHGFAKWQLPDRYEVIDAIPRTSTGKFWKLKLRERFPR